MSSGSSDIDPVELDQPQVPPVDNSSNEEPQPGVQRRGRDGPVYVRSQIQTARRNAQQIYDRRPPNTRNRSSSQQTESTSRPRGIQLAGQNGDVTILLRLLSQSPGQREPEVCTTIRMTIDVPETPLPMMSSQTIHPLNATIFRIPASAGQSRRHRRHRSRPAPEPYRQPPSEQGSQTGTAPPSELGSHPGAAPPSELGSQTGAAPPSELGSRAGTAPPSELGSQPGAAPPSELGSRAETEPPSEPELELPVQEPVTPADPQPQLSRRPSLQSQSGAQELDPNPLNPNPKNPSSK
ncbi:hypothetical protein AWZ03_000156 [Drosophila navojoa]|uniref:Uncharacterized protein n=1 Tax=Drosophila navojoa TaxID=7232 RepID=A0A484C2D7_DRONA|nr:hypothetical protein AWZ03_000156 [Drosophila navojoa]